MKTNSNQNIQNNINKEAEQKQTKKSKPSNYYMAAHCGLGGTYNIYMFGDKSPEQIEEQTHSCMIS